MIAGFEERLQAFAGVIVRVGLNLQPGQRLLIAEPYELQGVPRSAEVIVEAVQTAAGRAGCAGSEVIWGDGARLREYAARQEWTEFSLFVAGHAARMTEYVGRGDALLFLQGSQPNLLDGIAPAAVGELRRIGWEHLGPVIQQLVQGATNWTAAPAPSPAWANIVFADLPPEQRLAALWETVFASCRIGPVGGGEILPGALAAWDEHLRRLRTCRDSLNAQRLKTIRYQGDGTDLTVALPRDHVWCSAQLATKSGLAFVANLPTEEIFTLPHRDSATGTVRVSRPITYTGTVTDGIELVFRDGLVTDATATRNQAALRKLLATDDGSARLGEVAVVLRQTSLARSGRLYRHPLLDENASHHVALGESYAFCLTSPDPAAANRSLIHVDLPVDARVVLSQAEPG